MHALEMPPRHDGRGEVVILDPDDTVRIQRFRETGKTILRTMNTGTSSHTFERPEVEPYIAETLSLDQRIAQYKKYRKEVSKGAYSYSRPLDESSLAENASYQQWKSQLPTRKLCIAAAYDSIASADHAEARQIPCKPCESEGSYTQDCRCTILISSITSLTGISVSDREEGTADPSCNECDGTGRVEHLCMRCDGTGAIDLYPKIELYEPTADKWHTLRVDVAQLLLQSPDVLELKAACRETEVPRPALRASFVASYHLGAAIGNAVGVWRSDDEVVHVRFGEDYTYMREYDEFFDNRHSYIYRDEWTNASGRVSWVRAQGAKPDTRSPSAILDDYQHGLAAVFASDAEQWGSLSYRIHYAPTPERRFADLRSALGRRGLSLAVAHEFIATGETGPSLIAVSGEEAVVRLGQDYTVDRAVEGAWQAYLAWEAANS